MVVDYGHSWKDAWEVSFREAMHLLDFTHAKDPKNRGGMTMDDVEALKARIRAAGKEV